MLRQDGVNVAAPEDQETDTSCKEQYFLPTLQHRRRSDLIRFVTLLLNVPHHGGFHRILCAVDRRHSEHCHMMLCAVVIFTGPSVSELRLWMSTHAKHLHVTFPHRLALEGFVHRLGV